MNQVATAWRLSGVILTTRFDRLTVKPNFPKSGAIGFRRSSCTDLRLAGTCACREVDDRWLLYLALANSLPVGLAPNCSLFSLSQTQRHYQMVSPSVGTELQQINADPGQPTPGQGQGRNSSHIVSADPSAVPQHGGIEGANAQNGGGESTPSFPWEVPSIEDLKKEFRETYSQEDKDEALKSTVEVVKQYSDEMVKRWKEEIDTLLVYAGLFSAILTAFNVQSYILLQPSTPDPTLAVLQQISLQLNSFSVTSSGTLVNSTHPVTPFAPIPTAPVEAWAVWLNSLWFSALICSLASASIGILVKQWLHEYEAGISGTSVEIARLRQYRLNHLEKWRVAEIIAILPVLLQVSLALFLAGILVLLWHLHPTVASVASTLISLLLSKLFKALYNCCDALIDLEWLPVFIRSWFRDLSLWAMRQDWNTVTVPTWRGRERTAVQSSASELDVDMIAQAYSTTMNVNYLSDTAAAVLADKDTDAVVRCFAMIADINVRHFGHWHVRMRSPNFWAGALLHVSRKETCKSLFDHLIIYRSWYLGKRQSEHHSRLFLASAATVANPDFGSDVHSQSLWLVEHILRSTPAALEAMPWGVIHHLAAAAEMRLRQLMHSIPSDGGPGQPEWDTIIFLWLRILVKCWFAPASLCKRTQEETEASTAWVFGMDFLQKGSISKMAGKLSWSYPAKAMLESLDIILTYLGESEDARRTAPGDSLEAIGELVEYIEGPSRSADFWDDEDVQKALKELKRSLERCKTLRLGIGAEEGRIQASQLNRMPGLSAICERPEGQ
ncbi:hypothetical protein BD311DRAFT_743259 [Dichomitus squalens]|uniref:DUF6535 domain-containing protein n=1 Tax=Dichomitus squalens TaxID=114155 RepID=A0A4Q9M530_9APHY|nr:hypothetical protein BD311DRAFT_743259 [Dichomitus squalens]